MTDSQRKVFFFSPKCCAFVCICRLFFYFFLHTEDTKFPNLHLDSNITGALIRVASVWAACFWTENNPITAGKPHGVCSPLCCRLLSRRDFNLSTVPSFFYLYFSNPQLSSSPKKKKVPPSFSTAFISIPSSTFHNYMSPFLHDSLCSAAAFYPLTQFFQHFQRTIMEFYSTLAPPRLLFITSIKNDSVSLITFSPSLHSPWSKTRHRILSSASCDFFSTFYEKNPRTSKGGHLSLQPRGLKVLMQP